jgi:hypothetical protein
MSPASTATAIILRINAERPVDSFSERKSPHRGAGSPSGTVALRQSHHAVSATLATNAVATTIRTDENKNQNIMTATNQKKIKTPLPPF